MHVPLQVQGIYLFLWELIAIGLVAGKAIIQNGGRKYVRLAKDPECVVRWLDITSHGSDIACCKHNVSKDHWHAGRQLLRTNRIFQPQKGSHS